jgi:AraC family transcriptional regulator
MSTASLRAENLSAGRFYGNVPHKRALPSAILSEVVHRQALDVPEHSHELAYFTLLLSGSYFERFGSRSTDDRIGADGARCFTIEIRPGQLDGLHGFSPVTLDFAEHGTSLSWLGARLFREFKMWDKCSELVAEGLTLELLGHAARSASTVDRHPPKWLPAIEDRLKDQFLENISTVELANEAGVHPVHLASVFRRFHGQTIGEFIQQLRVAHASRLLIGGRAFAEVAYESGFADQSHFNRLFKRHTGMTPGAFCRTLT